MTTILLVDDETNILKALKRALKRENWNIITYDNPAQALEELALTPVDLVLTDYRMPQMTGVEFLTDFKAMQPDAIRLILSGQADLQGVLDAINAAQVYRFILKPWNDEELVYTLKNALEFQRLQRENRELAETVRNQSRAIKAQISELRRLENESPGITRVKFDENGIIDLSSEFED